MSDLRRALTAALVFAGAWGAPANAEDAPSPAFTIELNRLAPSDEGCLMTFVVTNGLGAGLDKAAFEVVLFDTEGLVERMTVFDFREVPGGKTKVRQFDLPGIDCGSVGSVLVNGAANCDGEGVEPGACMEGLKTRSQSGVEIEG